MSDAMSSCAAALALKPDDAEALFSRGVMLLAAARPQESLASFDRFLAIVRGHPDALSNRGLALLDLRRAADALASFEQALATAPGHVGALSNRGGALLAIGRLDAARASFRAVLTISPDHAGVHSDLGATLRDAADLEGALDHHRRAVALQPQNAGAREDLGNALRLNGDIASAVARYRQSLAIEPGGAGALGNLGYALLAGVGAAAALAVARRAFSIRPSREIATLLVKCLEEPVQVGADLWPVAARILSERWTRPGPLLGLGWHIVRSNDAVANAIAETTPAAASLSAIVQDALLPRLLVLSPVSGADLERLLTRLRAHLLDMAPDTDVADGSAKDQLGLFCALARQCFLNEYVFAATDEEIGKAERLRRTLGETIASGSTISPWLLAAVAAYFPLHSVPGIERLAGRSWPEDVDAVVTQQVREPMAEIAEAASIPKLTPIVTAVSQAVRRQYEESPYPRWVDTIASGSPVSIGTYLHQAFPKTSIGIPADWDGAEILIAGCGTGQQSIETAATFRNRSVLAVDLSLASLGYAKRKTRELGGLAIDYAQADLMELGSLDRDFDLIEASGVLHHLQDPFAGWRVLLSLLKPGGIMRLGLYSERARRHIVAARRLIAERNYGPSLRDIRAFRQELLTLGDRPWAASIVESGEFTTASACRDLLFHVQEHRLSLPQIAAFLDEEALRLIGFETSPAVQAAYAARFPGDPAMSDLAQWDVFEAENPDTFRGMYQFWVQKPG
jgi:tetratricopeptide (TPR) repeat protein/2-polyprenyl-3-methyl-5-hydroxy-6-metoxy-1,4-benzoquinol methylase